MKAVEQYFPVVLAIVLHKAVLTFNFSVVEIRKARSTIQMKGDEQYFSMLLNVYYAVPSGSNF